MKRRNFLLGAAHATAFVSLSDLAFAQAGGTLGVVLLRGKLFQGLPA
jgi:hypothetical protein